MSSRMSTAVSPKALEPANTDNNAEFANMESSRGNSLREQAREDLRLSRQPSVGIRPEALVRFAEDVASIRLAISVKRPGDPPSLEEARDNLDKAIGEFNELRRAG